MDSTGRIVKIGHVCYPPGTANLTADTIWQCYGCRKYWILWFDKWIRLSWLDPDEFPVLLGIKLRQWFRRN